MLKQSTQSFLLVPPSHPSSCRRSWTPLPHVCRDKLLKTKENDLNASACRHPKFHIADFVLSPPSVLHVYQPSTPDSNTRSLFRSRGKYSSNLVEQSALFAVKSGLSLRMFPGISGLRPKTICTGETPETDNKLFLASCSASRPSLHSYYVCGWTSARTSSS